MVVRYVRRAFVAPALVTAILASVMLAFAGLVSGCRRLPTAEARITKPDAPAQANGGASGSNPSGIQFENIAQASGIHYRWPQQPRPMRNVEAFGRGCAFLDFDNDGWQDILLVSAPHVILYHNKGNGTFDDVTRQAGLESVDGDWRGVGVGDFDGDGYLDIVLTGIHRLALLRNVNGSHFVDSTTSADLDPTNHGHWGSSAGFMDLDGSNRLSLVILNYVIFGPHEEQYCEIVKGVKSGCPPDAYRAELPELWQNVGGGHFKDITAASGLRNTHGKSLVVAFADIMGNGRKDFYIGNDTVPADFMENLGHLRFRNIADKSGLALGISGRAMAAMGADWGDYDRDGRLDLAVTGFSNEPDAVFHNLGHGLFENASDQLAVSGPTYKPLGFGAKWLDIDNDGWLDLAFANGHVYDNSDQMDPLTPLREPLILFHNENGKRFTDLVPRLKGDLARPVVGRGLASGDFDNDGRMDFLLVDYEGEPLLFHNLTRNANHWITLDLRGKSPNRFAYGARVTAASGGQVWVSEVSPASSYLSSSDPRIHFGLGPAAVLDSVTIHWSDGQEDTLHAVAADAFVTVEEGKGIVKRSPAAVTA